MPTASRAGDLQIGAGFALAKPDYAQSTFQGITAYGTFDFRPHLGIEAEFHQVDTSSGNQTYERTFEAGGRYFRRYGPAIPYVKGMLGRGVFNYPNGIANLAYNLFAVGVGADFNVGRYVRVRGEYELQRWSGFPPTGSLTPQLFTVGVAYHFNGKMRYGR
jgi:opacity protein-like surface antigen